MRRAGSPCSGNGVRWKPGPSTTVEGEDRTYDLYVPAPQSLLEDGEYDRQFRRHPASGTLDALGLAELIQREMRFDTDLWVIAVEDRGRRHFLDAAVIEDAQ